MLPVPIALQLFLDLMDGDEEEKQGHTNGIGMNGREERWLRDSNKK